MSSVYLRGSKYSVPSSNFIPSLEFSNRKYNLFQLFPKDKSSSLKYIPPVLIRSNGSLELPHTSFLNVRWGKERMGVAGSISNSSLGPRAETVDQYLNRRSTGTPSAVLDQDIFKNQRRPGASARPKGGFVMTLTDHSSPGPRARAERWETNKKKYTGNSKSITSSKGEQTRDD